MGVLFCLDTLSSLRILEILLINLLITLFSNGYTINKLNWTFLPEIYEVFCYLSFLYSLTATGTILTFISYKQHNLLYDKKSQFAILLSYLNLFLNVLGVLFTGISLVNVRNSFISIEKQLVQKDPKYLNHFKNNGQYYIFCYSETVTLVLNVISLLIWNSFIDRLKLKSKASPIQTEVKISREVNENEQKDNTCI